MNYFTQYWTNQQWDFQATLGSPGWDWAFPVGKPESKKARMSTIDHTAGNLFSKAGVKVGDVIFIVTVKKGKLFVAGKVVVGRICGQKEAEKLLKQDDESWPGLYEAKDHIIAAGRPDRFRPENRVPDKITKELYFEGADGPMPLKFDEPGYLNQQTLRGVRRLTPASAKLLQSLL